MNKSKKHIKHILYVLYVGDKELYKLYCFSRNKKSRKAHRKLHKADMAEE